MLTNNKTLKQTDHIKREDQNRNVKVHQVPSSLHQANVFLKIVKIYQIPSKLHSSIFLKTRKKKKIKLNVHL